jgi:SAM-dependent methyltransferase
MTAATDGYVTDVSYIPGFYPHLAPVAMRYAAALNRVAPPRTDSGFRYLELGCGLGRSLTTLAAANPGGEFVGVDINPAHTAAADRDIAAGGLTNARVITSGFAGLPADFIALHGVFSWVAPSVREEILAVARRYLRPEGLLLVSYNAMPGWAHLQPIRGILRQYAALRQGDSAQRVRDALAYLVFIRDRHAKYFDDNPRAAAYVDGTFVGSLPVFTNFWDLCVRPEFQELFRTTTNRLVTEAHKDFCANTAFRWDIYAKAPRLMPDVADRLRETDDLHFRVVQPGITLPWQANLGIVTSTVQGPVYQTLLNILGRGSKRLSEILADPAVSSLPPADVARAVDAGVAMGMFDVSAGPIHTGDDVTGRLMLPEPFNRALLESESLAGRPLALACPATGNGHTLGDLDAAILHELVERGDAGLAERIDARLTASGRTLERDGKPVQEAADRLSLVRAACDALRSTGLPQLARLGIVRSEA